MQNNFVVSDDYVNNKVNSLFFQVEYVLAMNIPLNNNLIKVSWNPPFRESPFYFAIIVKMGGFIVLIGYL